MIDFANGKFSAKALDFIHNADARLNIAHGSVRSSKTVNCTVRWMTYLLDSPPGDLMMVGKTLASLQRNVLNDIRDLVGSKYYYWIDRQKGELSLMGRRVHVVGANTVEAAERIQGATLAGAYCDEVSTYPQSCFDMLMTRLSIRGAKCFCNCNPAHPSHWFYVNYITNPEITDRKVWHFTLEDNPNLDELYVLSLKQSFSGVFYDRYIRGLWVAADGTIYRTFANEPEKFIIDAPPPVWMVQIGVDFGSGNTEGKPKGTGSANVFSCVGFTAGMNDVVALDEWYSKKQVDPAQLEEQFVRFVQKQKAAGYHIMYIYADSAEGTLIRGLQGALLRAGISINVKPSVKKPVNDRVRFICRILGSGNFKVMRHCEHLIDALKTAVWDADELDDVRLDNGTSDIDSLDAMEYATETQIKNVLDRLTIEGIKQNRGEASA